jgi:hypothetical protein
MRPDVSQALLAILFVIWNFNSSVLAADLVVRHLPSQGEKDLRNNYYIALLSLALEKTQEQYGAFRLDTIDDRMLPRRALEGLIKNELVDVIWSMTSLKKEALLRPIRIPLYKGLLGYRVLLIREQDQEKFRKIEHFNELKSLVAGQGRDWSDVSILQANGLSVATSAHYEGLFDMLRAGRFDYFPRGISEVWSEIRSKQTEGLVVEDSILLKYTAPMYFFVNNSNSSLAERIEKGLRLAISDGAFDKAFHKETGNKILFDLPAIKSRKFFNLSNPTLPDKTPVNDLQLWYSLEK